MVGIFICEKRQYFAHVTYCKPGIQSEGHGTDCFLGQFDLLSLKESACKSTVANDADNSSTTINQEKA